MILSLIKVFFNTLLELIYPEEGLCVLCDNQLDDVINHVCKECFNKLVFKQNKSCKVCGRPLKEYYIPDLCHDCIRKPQLYDRAISPLIYEDYTRECIHNFKYKKKPYMYKAFGSIMVECLKNNSDIKFDLIIPVPLNKKRMLERGFNQAELLSKFISSNFNITNDTKTLIRIKNTEKQNKLKREDRVKNMKNSFAVTNGERIKNKEILLVDDIFTTGTTINECCKVLLEAGAKKIFVITLAIGQNEYN